MLAAVRVLPALAVLAVAIPLSQGTALGTVTVTGVQANASSVKVSYQPVPGAADYRVYDTANPTKVKYAGLVHLQADVNCTGPVTSYCKHSFVTNPDGAPVFPYQVTSGHAQPNVLDVPATSIEWNSMDDGQPHTLVVQAVDQLGPVPSENLYDTQNTGLYPMPGMGMLGSNAGMTADGLTSTNGQGPYTDQPQVIAQSQPFTVQASEQQPIPSRSDASQTYMETFDANQGESITQTAVNANKMTASYRLNGPNPASIIDQGIDTRDTTHFLMAGHYMDVLFDGGTPGTGNPLHTAWGSSALTPDQTVDPTNGILHVTFESDGHFTGRRWIDLNLAPAAAPLQLSRWDSGDFSATDQAFVLALNGDNCTTQIFTNSDSGHPVGVLAGFRNAQLWGINGNHCNAADWFDPSSFEANGNGFDNRIRYDLYLSQSHVALFADGRLIHQSDIPAGAFPWFNQPLQVYVTHYVYHDHLDQTGLEQGACYPENAYWFDDAANGSPLGSSTSTDNACQPYPSGDGFPHSDERHWENFGAEVLPPSDAASASDFSNLAPSLPPILPPQ